MTNGYPAPILCAKYLRVKLSNKADDGITAGELGQRVSLDGSAITGILDRMEKDGYVKRHPNVEDRRSALVYLTPEALEVGPEIIKFAEELYDSMRRRFAPSNMEIFERVLYETAESQEHI